MQLKYFKNTKKTKINVFINLFWTIFDGSSLDFLSVKVKRGESKVLSLHRLQL